MIDMIHHQHSAKKISDQTVIFLLCSYQATGKTNSSRFVQSTSLIKLAS